MTHHLADKNYITFFENYAETEIVFGEAPFTALSEKLLVNRQTATAVIFGGTKSSVSNGAYAEFFKMALSLDLNSPIFRDVPPEPDFECVRNIVAFLEENQPEIVLAIGGGSVMDAAKAACLAWQCRMDPRELVGVNKASEKFPGQKFKRVVCVPTTAGTGSEVTPYANIVDAESNVKYIICEKQIIPELALISPDFSVSMPQDLTISTALDAMTHALESFLNIKAESRNPEVENYAISAVKQIVYALPKVLKNPSDHLAREILAAAATLGGMAITNRPTSLPHLCSYSVTGKIPHGLAVALLLCPCWKYYLSEPAIQEQTMKLAGLFPSAERQDDPQKVIAACECFIEQVCGMKSLREHPALTPELIEKIAAESVLNPVKLATAPKEVPADQARQIIHAILSGN